VNIEKHLEAVQCEHEDELGGRDQESMKMHVEAEIELNNEMPMEAEIEQTKRCTWRP
jgi:hypothetical protein